MKKIYLAAIAVAALTVSSCSQDEVLNMSPEAGPQAISFNGAYVGNAAETRGSVATIENLKDGAYDEGLGVFANYTTGNYDVSNASNWTNIFMNNLNVTWNGSAWTCADHYWPTTGMVSFVAYAPYDDATTQNSATAIAHTVSSTIGSQTDLVVSDLVPNQTRSSNTTTPGRVDFTMKHVLSKIGLKMTEKNLPEGFSITLTSVELGDAATTGAAFYSSGSYNAVNALNGNGTWSSQAGNQELKWESGDLGNDGKVTNPAGEANDVKSISNNEDKYLFVIPQDFTGKNLPIRISYNLTVPGGATLTGYGFSGKINQNFEKGKAYLINFEMDYSNLPGGTDPGTDKPLKITFDVTVSPWDPSTGGVNTSLTFN